MPTTKVLNWQQKSHFLANSTATCVLFIIKVMILIMNLLSTISVPSFKTELQFRLTYMVINRTCRYKSSLQLRVTEDGQAAVIIYHSLDLKAIKVLQQTFPPHSTLPPCFTASAIALLYASTACLLCNGPYKVSAVIQRFNTTIQVLEEVKTVSCLTFKKPISIKCIK